jgi:DNA-binding NarL/FixJ family response regulator
MRASSAGRGGEIHRVLIVDDHPVITEGLGMVIDQEPDFEVCGRTDNVPAALDILSEQTPDAAIVDISLEGGDGLDLIKLARDRGFRLPILVLSAHDEVLYAERALRAGASGYLMKRESLTKVLVALRLVLQGSPYFSDEIKNRMLFALAGGHDSSNPIDLLTDRELQVFRLIGEGHKTSQIADLLCLGMSTVETHRRNMRHKLGLESGQELVHHATIWWQEQQES